MKSIIYKGQKYVPVEASKTQTLVGIIGENASKRILKTLTKDLDLVFEKLSDMNPYYATHLTALSRARKSLLGQLHASFPELKIEPDQMSKENVKTEFDL